VNVTKKKKGHRERKRRGVTSNTFPGLENARKRGKEALRVQVKFFQARKLHLKKEITLP